MILTRLLQIRGDLYKTVTRNGAWAVNQSSRGFSAQLSESWAYLSPYSAEQKKKHTLLSLHFLALSLPSTSSSSSSPLPLFCDEWKVWILLGLPGSLSEALSSWTNNTLSNLKAQSGIYLNHVRFGYICVWPWSAPKRNMESRFFWRCHNSQPGFPPPCKICNFKQNFYELVYQIPGNDF